MSLCNVTCSHRTLAWLTNAGEAEATTCDRAARPWEAVTAPMPCRSNLSRVAAADAAMPVAQAPHTMLLTLVPALHRSDRHGSWKEADTIEEHISKSGTGYRVATPTLRIQNAQGFMSEPHRLGTYHSTQTDECVDLAIWCRLRPLDNRSSVIKAMFQYL